MGIPRQSLGTSELPPSLAGKGVRGISTRIRKKRVVNTGKIPPDLPFVKGART